MFFQKLRYDIRHGLRNNKIFLFLVPFLVLVLFVLVMFILISPRDLVKLPFTFISGLYILFGLILFLISVILAGAQYRRESLKLIFNLEWDEAIEGVAQHQRDVDLILRYHAQGFASACKNRSLVLGASEHTSHRPLGVNKPQTLEETRLAVARTKSRFWEAHELANLAGFKVRKNLVDYLRSSV
jgi:hypothetical protein